MNYLELVKDCCDKLQKINNIKLQFVKDKIYDNMTVIQEFLIVSKEIINIATFQSMFVMEKSQPSFKLMKIISEDDSVFIVELQHGVTISETGELVVLTDNNELNSDGNSLLDCLTDKQLYDVYISLMEFINYINDAYSVLLEIINNVNQELYDADCKDIIFGNVYMSEHYDEIQLQETSEPQTMDDDLSNDDEDIEEETIDLSNDDDLYEEENFVENEEYMSESLSESNKPDDMNKLQLIVNIDSIDNYKREKWKTYHEVKFNTYIDGEKNSVSFMISSRCCKLVNDDKIEIILEPNNHYKLYKSNGKPVKMNGTDLQKYYNDNAVEI